jgi:cytochrome bd-type quinol oxidase subunit 2
VIAGWGLCRYPWMLVDQLTINDAAGAQATFAALLVVAVAVVIVLEQCLKSVDRLGEGRTFPGGR